MDAQLKLSLQKKESECVLDEALCEKNTQIINNSVHCADQLLAVKKIAQEKSAEVDQLQSVIAEKERAEVELQQKLTGIQSENAQLKESLLKKEGKHVLDEALCEECMSNQRFCILCR